MAVNNATMQTPPTREQLLDTLRTLGHPVFTAGDFNLNLVGIRAADRRPDAFDDLICCAWREADRWLFRAWPATTDPGLPFLREPMNAGGTAILAEGHHRRCWAIGLHLGRIRALVQVAPMRVYRDGNRDDQFDLDPQTITEGVYGINLHPAWSVPVAQQVGRWSAGCQVPQRVRDFQELLARCETSSRIFGNRFSYTLIREEDLM